MVCNVAMVDSSHITYKWYFIERHKSEEVELKDEQSEQVVVMEASYMNSGVYRCEVSDGEVITDATAEVIVLCKLPSQSSYINTDSCRFIYSWY